MKIMLYFAIFIFLIIILWFVNLSIASRKQPELGLLNDQLRTCPATPNCVCSEWPVEGAYIEPFEYSSTAEQAWGKIKQAIIATGGDIVTEQNPYLHARYETSLMRYVDDVELRLDNNTQRIHIRSASRVGKSDLGANRQRVEKIREQFTRQ